MERNVRQLEVIFPVDGELQKVNVSTVYSYVENFGPIVSCEKSRNGLDIRMIEADGVPMNWFNRCHEIDGHRVRMRREMHILDLPLFCLKVICKWLLNTIDDLCSVTEVCTTLKDAATLTFEGEFSKRGIRFAMKMRMQADVRLFQCFLHSITRLEINAEDRQHFTYILASLKKISPNNVLKYLIFSNKRISYWRNSREHANHFSHLSKAELEDLFSVFSYLEGLSYNTWKFAFPRLPPNLRILSLNCLYDGDCLSETSDVINANLQKIVIRAINVYSLTKIAQLLQLSPQIKEITIYGWQWPKVGQFPYELYKIDDLLQYAPQLEVLSIYTVSFFNPSIDNIQPLRKMRNLKILNLSLTDPPIEILNAINELNVVVECLTLSCRRWNYELSHSISNFNQLKLLRIKSTKPLSLEGLPELVGRLPRLSALVLTKHLITLDLIKKIISAGSKLTDFHVGQVIELEHKLDTKQYLEIVSAVRSRSNERQLTIWLTKHFSINIDSKVYCNNVKYVNVLLKRFKYKSYPPCGFTV